MDHALAHSSFNLNNFVLEFITSKDGQNVSLLNQVLPNEIILKLHAYNPLFFEVSSNAPKWKNEKK